MTGLLGSRRFLPLFAAQLGGALNDNLFKNAIVVLVLFRGSGNALLVPLAGGIFILPYALFSALAGQLADRLAKHRLIRATKLAEIAVMTAAAVGLLTGSEPLLLAVLFALGTQAAFFGPLKYGILPELIPPALLVEANGLVEASTFIGILAGTVLGGVLILLPHGPVLTSSAAIAVAVAGYAASRAVPSVAAAAPGLAIGRNIWRETARLIGQARSEPLVWSCILGLSWFWALGAAFLAAFPIIVKQRLGAGGEVVTLLLAVFSVGIGLGSLLAGQLLRGAVSARPVVPAAVVLSLFALDFAWTAATAHAVVGGMSVSGLPAVWAVLRTFQGWRIVLDLLGVSVCGGVYSVPLYALLQHGAAVAWRARMVAANNIMNAAFMVGAALVLAAGAAARLGPCWLLAGFAAANLAVAALLHGRHLPGS